MLLTVNWEARLQYLHQINKKRQQFLEGNI